MGVKVRLARSHRCFLVLEEVRFPEVAAAAGRVLVLGPLTRQHLLSLSPSTCGERLCVSRHAWDVCRKECSRLWVLVQFAAQLQLFSCKIFIGYLRIQW